MKQAHLYISGFVQGVGYRAFVKKTAQKLELKGWVRNLEDRRVEIVVQGSGEPIKELISKCENGPFFAEVKNITVDWENGTEEYGEFVIRRE